MTGRGHRNGNSTPQKTARHVLSSVGAKGSASKEQQRTRIQINDPNINACLFTRDIPAVILKIFVHVLAKGIE
jgi:hypothetical protein